jgi:DNA modification methylase
MVKRRGKQETDEVAVSNPRGRRSALLDTRVIYCGDCLDQLRTFPAACVDLIYIDPPFNSNRNYEVFWGETKEKRAFEDRHASTAAYIDFMRPRCVELAGVLKKTGSFYYHCDWHASRQYHDSAFTRATRPILHQPCSWEVKHRDNNQRTT